MAESAGRCPLLPLPTAYCLLPTLQTAVSRPTEIIELFCLSWPLEVCFRDVNQLFGFEDLTFGEVLCWAS